MLRLQKSYLCEYYKLQKLYDMLMNILVVNWTMEVGIKSRMNHAEQFNWHSDYSKIQG